MSNATTTIACCVAISVSFTTTSPAQVRASERGKVAQTVDGTVITVDYGRPQARGRDSLFGNVVRRGEIWTPGANWATTLEVSRDVRLNGHPVAAGKYSVWMAPRPEGWTVHLHRNAQLYHTQKPKPEEMFLSFPVTTRTIDHVEILTFDFPIVRQQGATLRLRWGTVEVPLEIEVQPTRATRTLSEEELAPYLGSYLLTIEEEPGHPSPEMKGEVVNASGALRLVVDGMGGAFAIEFIPTAEPHRFRPALMEKGQIVDVEEVPAFFEMEGGRAVGFRIMGIGDDIWIRAKRKG